MVVGWDVLMELSCVCQVELCLWSRFELCWWSGFVLGCWDVLVEWSCLGWLSCVGGHWHHCIFSKWSCRASQGNKNLHQNALSNFGTHLY